MHQVLARKWRPRRFDEVIGQTHVVQALSNALTQQLLHHAYLFTGTRGVGKTTIARILAKCLNCEEGLTASPCGQCSSCLEIDSGNFPDLYEVDAASRTKVEDTRELLDNVQYAPTKGRFKIYLIDEVHMLSGHSFNALLKTLEEPPEHVKFLLATTDPQRLPATVLSRCLQFHLSLLPSEQIANHLQAILKQESIQFDQEATLLISNAANGSMRDALSLLDQGIAYGNGKVLQDEVKAMLGTIEPTALYDILNALSEQDATALLQTAAHLSEQGVDFAKALADLLSLLHQIAVIQAVNQSESTEKMLFQLSEKIACEDIQLYYQIVLIGQRDLAHAPTPRAGFEMTLLRMLAFTPNTKTPPSNKIRIQSASKSKTNNTTANSLSSENQWSTILPNLAIKGASLALAQQCSLIKLTEDTAFFHLQKKHQALLQQKFQDRISDALSQYFKKSMKVIIDIAESNIETPASLAQKEKENRISEAEHAIYDDEKVKQIIQTFDATIVKDSITPNDHH